MNRTCLTLVAQVALALHALSIASYGDQKPTFQYEVGDIHVSIPSSDEPRVQVFGPESIKLAGKYLETGAVSWARSNGCVNCHTTGPYLTEYTAWSRQFGKPSEEVYATFLKSSVAPLSTVVPASVVPSALFEVTTSVPWLTAVAPV